MHRAFYDNGKFNHFELSESPCTQGSKTSFPSQWPYGRPNAFCGQVFFWCFPLDPLMNDR
jgi:hypothetical protein